VEGEILLKKTNRLRLKCDGTRAETRFRLSAKRTSPFKSAGGVSSVDYRQASCTHQSAGFVLLVQACVLQSCDVYWLPNPFSCFPLQFSSLASPRAFTFQLDTTSSLLGPKCLTRHQILKRIQPSHNMRDKFSHPYTTTDNILVPNVSRHTTNLIRY
jgi:hypothetical protein